MRIRRVEGVAIHERHSEAIRRAESKGDHQEQQEERKRHLGDFLALTEATVSRTIVLYRELQESWKSETELFGGFSIMEQLAQSTIDGLKRASLL